MKIVNLEENVNAFRLSQSPIEACGELISYAHTDYAQIPERIRDADIVIINKSRMDEGSLKGAKKLKLICEAATGLNNVDLNYCCQKGIGVANVEGYSTDCVAQHTFAMLFALLEKLPYYTRFVEQGDYCRFPEFSHLEMPIHQLSAMTFGVVGMGHIGQKTAQLAHTFGAKVLTYSASGKRYSFAYRQVNFEELLAECDIISIHCPLTEKTKGLFNYEAFRKMKKNSILLNLARGPIVKSEDLVRAMKEGLIYGAGLDVFETEPMEEDSPLLSIQDPNRLILTPHIGWGSVEARTTLINEVAENIKAFLAGKSRNRVDLEKR